MPFADPTLIILGAAGVTCLVMLVAISRGLLLRRGAPLDTRAQDRTSWLLIGYIFVTLGWVTIQGLHCLQTLRLIAGFDLYALQRISIYLLLALGVLFLQLTRAFQRRAGAALAAWLVGLLFLAAGAMLYENPLRLRDALFQLGGSVFIRWLLAFAMLVTGWAVCMAWALLLTARSYRASLAPLHRNRVLYWSLAATLALAGGVIFLLRGAAVGNLLHLLAVFIAVYAVLTHNLTDLRLTLRRFAIYVIMLLLTVAVYTGGFYAIQRFFGSAPGYTPLLGGAIMAVAMAALFNPLLNLVRRFASHLISGARYDLHQTLSQYSLSISNILDMEVLSTVVVGLISDALDVRHGALISVHHEPDAENRQPTGGVYRLHSISGLGEELPEGRLSARNPVVYYLSHEHHPLTQYDVDLQPRFHGMDAAERAWLNRLKMDIFVPIYAKDTWIGLLALGPKAGGDRYYDDDVVFLQTLADQTAVAFENARLYQDLKQRNAENERLNVELKAANEQLARLDQAKSDFINIASHELRTPLTQVIGYNDILGEMIHAQDLTPATGAQMIDSVRKAARRLEEIVETMFDVSKLDTNTMDLMHEPVSLTSVISAGIETWARGLDERHINVTVRGVSNLPAIVADSKRMTQVFSHLIQNAIKSTPDHGQVRISGQVVAASEQALAGQNGIEPLTAESYVEIVVADTGIGIAREDLERIFDKFFRVGNVLLHSTGDTKFKGAGPGLGLTIARGIVEAHGGRIWADSPGRDEQSCPGARFHVLLPVRAVTMEMPDLRAGQRQAR